MERDDFLMKAWSKRIAGTTIILLSPLALADDTESCAHFDRQRGECSPGTGVPSCESLTATVDTAPTTGVMGVLEYGERAECHGALPLLQSKLFDSDPRVRQAAAWWLRRRSFGIGEIIRNVKQVLTTDSDPVRRGYAAEALGEFLEPNVFASLRTAGSSDSDASVRTAAVHAIGRMNYPDAQDALVEAFRDPEPSVRSEGLSQVLRVTFFNDGAALIPLLADADSGVRTKAARLVGELRVTSGAGMLAFLLGSDPDPNVRQAAAWALGRIGTADARTALEKAQATEAESLVEDAIRIALRMLTP